MSLERLWLPLGQLWVPFGSFGSPWAPFGCSLGPFGSLWPALGLPLALFGSRWGALRPHWQFYWKLDVLYREMCQIHETINKKQLFGICHPSHPSPRNPRNPWKWCQQVLLRASLPHAPGVRMTGVKQTPSNHGSRDMMHIKLGRGPKWWQSGPDPGLGHCRHSEPGG